MKKISLSKKTLHLQKKKISTLTPLQMNHTLGGEVVAVGEEPDAFTYSLSLGNVCKASNKVGAYHDAYQCGKYEVMQSKRDCQG